MPRLPRARACSVDCDCDVPALLLLLWCAGGSPAERGEVGPANPEVDVDVDAKPLEDEDASLDPATADPAIPRLFDGEPYETMPALPVPAADAWR